MKYRPIYVADIVKKFNLIVVSGENKVATEEIKTQEVNRPGLELLGYFEFSDLTRINLLGNKEFSLIKTIDSKDIVERYEMLTTDKTPAIILTAGHLCPDNLLEIAKKKNFIILRSTQKTSLIQSELMIYLNERMAPMVSIHATLVELYGSGILLMGESGIGKSEIALELLKRGHQLIADDRVDIYKVRDTLIGYSPDVLKGYIEVRGLGIMNIEKLFGSHCISESVKIDYIINLIEFSKEYKFERFGIDLQTQSLLNVEVVSAELPVSPGRNMADLVEIAVSNLRAKSKDDKENNFEKNYEAHRKELK